MVRKLFQHKLFGPPPKMPHVWPPEKEFMCLTSRERGQQGTHLNLFGEIRCQKHSCLEKQQSLWMETGIGGVKPSKIRGGGVKILNFQGPLKLTPFYRVSIENRQFGGQKSKFRGATFGASSPPSSVRYVLTPPVPVSDLGLFWFFSWPSFWADFKRTRPGRVFQGAPKERRRGRAEKRLSKRLFAPLRFSLKHLKGPENLKGAEKKRTLQTNPFGQPFLRTTPSPLLWRALKPSEVT